MTRWQRDQQRDRIRSDRRADRAARRFVADAPGEFAVGHGVAAGIASKRLPDFDLKIGAVQTSEMRVRSGPKMAAAGLGSRFVVAPVGRLRIGRVQLAEHRLDVSSVPNDSQHTPIGVSASKTRPKGGRMYAPFDLQPAATTAHVARRHRFTGDEQIVQPARSRHADIERRAEGPACRPVSSARAGPSRSACANRFGLTPTPRLNRRWK